MNYNVIFSLESLACKLYNTKSNYKLNIDYKKFAKLLYGDIYYDEKIKNLLEKWKVMIKNEHL